MWVFAVGTLAGVAASPAKAALRCQPKENEHVKVSASRLVVLVNRQKRVVVCARANGRRSLLARGSGDSFEDDLLRRIDDVAGRFIAVTVDNENGASGPSTRSEAIDVVTGHEVSLAYSGDHTSLERLRMRRDGLIVAGLRLSDRTVPKFGRIVACRFVECDSGSDVIDEDRILAEAADVRPATVRLGRRVCWRATGRECSPLPPRRSGRCRPRAHQRVRALYPTIAILVGRRRRAVACLRRTGRRRELVPAGAALDSVTRVRGSVIIFVGDYAEEGTYDTALDVRTGAMIDLASRALGLQALVSLAIARDGGFVAGVLERIGNTTRYTERVRFCRLPACDTAAEGEDIGFTFLDGDRGCWVRGADEATFTPGRIECAPLPQ